MGFLETNNVGFLEKGLQDVGLRAAFIGVCVEQSTCVPADYPWRFSKDFGDVGVKDNAGSRSVR